MKLHDVKQGSGEWLALRLGIPTASEMDALVSPKGEIRTGKGPKTYLYQKVCERVLGFAPQAGSFAMEQGTILETEARPWYAFTKDVTVETAGFITTDDGRAGCSPDGLVNADGGLEIKCFQPEHSLRCLIENAIPDEYVMQVQMSLFVTGRAWWDFLSYSRQFPAVVIRVTPDEKLQGAIRLALAGFTERFDAAVAKVNALRDGQFNPKKEAYLREVAAYEAANPKA